MDPVNVLAKFEVRSFIRSWDNNNWSFGWVANPKSWGRGGRRGSGMVPLERALVSSYRPSMVTFPLSLRVSEILPLLCSNAPLFPTPPLVSPNFPQMGGLWATKSEDVGLIVCVISFQDFQPMWFPIHQRHRQTDRRTDDMRSQYRALHYSASRGKNG